MQAVVASQEDKQDIKSKENAIKCCKENKITPPPYEILLALTYLLNKEQLTSVPHQPLEDLEEIHRVLEQKRRGLKAQTGRLNE